MKKENGFVRKWLLNGSMAAALVASLAIFVVMLQIEKNTLAQYERVLVYTAAKEIPEGQLVTEENYKDYFEETLLDKRSIPPTAIREVSQINGLVAKNGIDEGVFLTLGMFETLNEITAGMKEPVIVGLKAEDLYQVAGGILRAGDRIHIYSVDEEGAAALVWEDVFIQSVFDQTGVIVANDDEETAVQRINVYLDKSNVEKFYSELASQTLRVAKAEE